MWSNNSFLFRSLFDTKKINTFYAWRTYDAEDQPRHSRRVLPASSLKERLQAREKRIAVVYTASNAAMQKYN
jgi:hypothetical protein